MKIKQIKIGFDNFSYVIFDEKSKKATVIDPSTSINKTQGILESKKLELKYIINTHHHVDHTSKNKKLRELHSNAKIVASEREYGTSNVKIDIKVNDNSKLYVGNICLDFLLTPGHSTDGLCIIADNKALFTGDTLFIDDCGRANLPGGNIKDLFESLQRIKDLSNDLIIYPGHNYSSKPFDTLGNQIEKNKTLLAKNLDEFKKIE